MGRKTQRPKRRSKPQMTLRLDSSPLPDDLSIPDLKERIQQKLECVWQQHRHLHQRFTLKQALDDPMFGRALRIHANLPTVLSEASP